MGSNSSKSKNNNPKVSSSSSNSSSSIIVDEEKEQTETSSSSSSSAHNNNNEQQQPKAAASSIATLPYYGLQPKLLRKEKVNSRPRGVSFSHDGKFLYVAVFINHVLVLNVDDGSFNTVAKLPDTSGGVWFDVGQGSPELSAEQFPKYKYLVASTTKKPGNMNQELTFWSSKTGTDAYKVEKRIKGESDNGGGAEMISFHPFPQEKTHVVVCCSNNVSVFDYGDKSCHVTSLKPNTGGDFFSSEYSHTDGKHIMVSKGHHMFIFDSETFEETKQIFVQGRANKKEGGYMSPSRIYEARYMHKKDHVVCGMTDGRVAIYDASSSSSSITAATTTTEEQPILLIDTETEGSTSKGGIFTCAPDKTDTMIAVGHGNGIISIFSATNGSRLFALPYKAGDWLRRVCWSPDSLMVASGSDDYHYAVHQIPPMLWDRRKISFQIRTFGKSKCATDAFAIYNVTMLVALFL